MPRKQSAIALPASTRDVKASLRAILDSSLFREAELPGRPWDLTKTLFVQLCLVRWTHGTASSAFDLANAAYNDQLTLVALLLYQDRHIQMRWSSAIDLRGYLDDVLKQPVRRRPVSIAIPPGQKLGGTTVRENLWDTYRWDRRFPEVLDEIVEKLAQLEDGRQRRGVIVQLAKAFLVPESTIHRYLDDRPEMRQRVNAAIRQVHNFIGADPLGSDEQE